MKPLVLAILLCIIVFGCYRDKDYLPTKVNADEVILSLSATPDTIPADAQSFAYILAELPLDATDTKSTVTFTTSKGNFDNNSKTISQTAVLVNDNGSNKRIAKVKLFSTSQIDTAEISATVANVTKTTRVVFSNLLFDSFLTLSADQSSIPADGASYSLITVEQPLNIPVDYSAVTFTTTAGSFDNGSKTITKSSSTVLVNWVYKRLAQVRLTSSKNEEKATIEASIKGTLKTIVISFTKAFPEAIKAVVVNPFITSGVTNSLQITTNLLRSVGTPTIGNEASLKVIDSNNVARGSFINYTTKSDANGNIVNKYTLGTDPYKGALRIVAQGIDATGNALRDTVTISVQ